MTISLTNDQVRFLRLRAQRLTPQSPGEATLVVRVVKEMCGVQAQDASAATLTVRARSDGLVAAHVEHARVQERSVVRTWGPRGTLHLLASDDLVWLLPLLGPVFVAADRRRREELGLDEDVCARGIHIIRNVLANQGPLTRAELFEPLTLHGIHLEGQARPHLLFRAALEGITCLGPDRGAEPTYVLLNDWVGQERRGRPLSEDEAYAELTRRYLSAYGPATPEDQAAWSGLPLSKIRAVWHHIADQLMEIEFAGSPAWMLKTRAAWLDELSTNSPIVRLLPRFDIYLLGYRNRDLAVPPRYAKRINAGGGIIHPTVLVDGRVVGTWKSKREKSYLDVVVEPFDQLAPAVYAGLEVEVADLARFLGVKATLRLMTLP
jgi:Winged helix DNA-binding domain